MDTSVIGAPVFEGLPHGALTLLLGHLERRTFEPGATVLDEGDFLGEMYIVQSGQADVVMHDADGVEHVINRVGPGGTLGEIALITGQPHSATVRTSERLDVLVLSDRELREAASAFPDLYRNLVAILSRRLVRSNRIAVGATLGRVTLLLDDGAPPLLGYALACSVAWHAQCSTLLLRIDDQPPSEALAAIAQAEAAPILTDGGTGAGTAHPPTVTQRRAFVLLTPPTGAFAPDMLATTLDHLSSDYRHILVQMPAGLAPALNVRRRIRLGSRGSSAQGSDTLIRAWSDAGNGRPDRQGVVDVPALDASEEAQLRAGILRYGGRTGWSLGWAARHVAGLKVGLALGAGSVRGFAHVGVLRVLERNKLPVDYIAGTSIGATVAALYALGHRADEVLNKLQWGFAAAFRITIPTRGLLSSAPLAKRLRELGGNTRIEDLAVPLALTATDLNTRREVVFRTGLLWPAVLASLTIPGVYPAVNMGGFALVDGGMSNPVPASAVTDMGADTVVAVKLLGGGQTHTPEYMESMEPTGNPPRVLEVLLRSLEIVQGHVPNHASDVATVVIAPEFAAIRGLGLRNFQDGVRFVAVGEAAAEASLPRLAATLPWLRE